MRVRLLDSSGLGGQRFSLMVASMGSMGRTKVRIGSIVLDCHDLARVRGFWQEALGYVSPNPPTPGDPFVILKDPEGKGPNVSIDQMEPYRKNLNRSSTLALESCFPAAGPGTLPIGMITLILDVMYRDIGGEGGGEYS